MGVKLMIFFNKESYLKKKHLFWQGGGGREGEGARVSEFFLQI